MKTATRLKEFEDLPQAQQRSLVQKIKKAVRTRWLSLDAGAEAAYIFLHTLRATAAERLNKVDDMKFLTAQKMF